MKKPILLLITITFTSCGPSYYAPNSQNIPVMKEKGQTNVSMGINTTDRSSGFEMQGAYGLTDKIALQFNTDWTNSSESNSSGSGHLIELGAGYYKQLQPHFIFETYGLVGFGKVQNEDSTNYSYNDLSGNISANFFRLGVQPSFSFTSKYFNASFSSRIANLHYNNINGNLPNISGDYNQYPSEADYLRHNNSQWVFEPGFTLQGGFEKVKLQLQYVHSFNLTNTDFPQDYDLISIALKYNFGTNSKK